MVVASGQYPYEYEARDLPIRGPIATSGILLEQGMFVIHAELRLNNQDAGNAYTHLGERIPSLYINPIITPSGFEPKADGSTLGGFVGGPGLVDIDNILAMRDALFSSSITGLFRWYATDMPWFNESIGRLALLETWFTGLYPESPSGYVRKSVTSFDGGTPLRPELTSVINANDHIDTNLHWLGGSGIIFDIDVGEVIFQPFPFFGRIRGANMNSPIMGVIQVRSGPIYPAFQKTDGSLITLTGREVRNANVNFDAIASGKLQVDGRALLPQSRLRLVIGNSSNYFPTLSPISTFVFFERGARQVDAFGSFPQTDHHARTYWSPVVLSSGFYTAVVDNPRTSVARIAVSSGIASFFPPIDHRNGFENQELGRCLSASSNGALVRFNDDGELSNGYQVFNDCIWMTNSNGSLSGLGSTATIGVFPFSPFNGSRVWFRPASLVVATSGNKPTVSSEYTGGVANGTPGDFGVHVGLETFDTDKYIRVSRVWTEVQTTPTNFINTIRFQIYDRPTLTHTETSVGWAHNGGIATIDQGFIDTAITDLFFDGTHYWVSTRFTRLHRFTTSLVFDGTYTRSVAAGGSRRAFINSEYIYWRGGKDATLAGSDPLLTDANMTNYTPASGIGKWTITSHPSNILMTTGRYTNDSAKPIRGDTVVGNVAETNSRIHDIIQISSSQHITAGIWVLIEFNNTLWLLRITEESDHYRILEAIRIHDVSSTPTGGDASDYPFEIIYHEID